MLRLDYEQTLTPHKMFTYIKKPPVYIGIIIIAGLITAYFFTLGKKPAQGEAATVTRGDITEEVFITGTVKAARAVSLSFDRGGSIKSLPFPVGSSVAQGAIIASLQNESEQALVAEGKALVARAEAHLADVHKGTREEEIRLKEAEARKAEVSLENTKSKSFSVLTDAYGSAEESLNRYADPLFQSDDTLTPRLSYGAGTQEAYDAEQKRVSAGKSVRNLQKTAQGDWSAIAALESVLKDLRIVQDMFVTLGLTLWDNSALGATTLSDYRSRVTSARSALASAIASVQNQMSALKDGAAELDRASRALELARAGATVEVVAKAEQELAQAQAKLRGMIASLEKTLLRAPFSGKVSSKNVEVGETIQAGQIIMEFLGTDGFIIEANVPEADVAKLEKGGLAEVTLDAYGDAATFPARVTLIEPSSTKIEGVPTYKTTLAFEKQDARLRSGLTANMTIKNLSKKNVLLVPARAVVSENGMSFATKMRADGSTEKVSVKTGIRSGTREVEIVEGLSEGDRIVIPQMK